MKIGSRESKLAMRQTDMFVDAIQKQGCKEKFDIIGIKSLGDIDLTSSLDKMSNVGAFVRELDEAILKKEIDISVNSLKDIPIDMQEGLVIGAIMRRNAPEDVILPCPLAQLPEGATVGTASVRRMSLLKDMRPDLKTKTVRGNIHTRLDKLDAGEFDALILAKAGLDRMGIERPMYILDPKTFVPATAQGAIAVECREDDKKILEMLKLVDDKVTRECVTIERSIMKALGAGCSSPVGINVRKLVKGFDVNAVSYAFTERPVRAEVTLPYDYKQEQIAAIADYLKGNTKELNI
ncbi:MAG: hydroxymethylbilane synthase [Candidatus Methanomethylophilaceae archaeon]